MKTQQTLQLIKIPSVHVSFSTPMFKSLLDIFAPLSALCGLL